MCERENELFPGQKHLSINNNDFFFSTNYDRNTFTAWLEEREIFPHVVAPLGPERSKYNLYSAKQETITPGALPARPSKKHHTAESSLVK